MNESVSWDPSLIKKFSCSNHYKLLNQLRNEVKKYLPEILGRVLARTWIDEDFKDTFKKDPLNTLSDNGVFLPDEMFLEFQKPDTKRPKIVVYERKGKSNFKVRVVQLQLIMMAGR